MQGAASSRRLAACWMLTSASWSSIPTKSIYRESEKPGERLAQPATAPKIDMPPLSFACD
jgi:hypothetical protein